MLNPDEIIICDNCSSENCPSLKGGESQYDPADDYEEEKDLFN